MDLIDQRLHRAARVGDAAALLSLIQEDPLILKKIECTSAAGNPLHVASLRGDHVDSAKELLKQQLKLAGMRNKKGSYPIHLAAARGRFGVVKQILGTNNPSIYACKHYIMRAREEKNEKNRNMSPNMGRGQGHRRLYYV